jgi:Tfp pilus assembly PilM family ATPase
MLSFLKNRTYLSPRLKTGSIGVDIGDDSIRLAQLSNNGKGISIIASKCETCPEDIKPGSALWQRWAVEAIREAISNRRFNGKNVVAAIPAGDVFIDHIKMGSQFLNKVQNRVQMPVNDEKILQHILSKIKQKLPFEPADAMIRYIPAEQDCLMVLATDRKIIDRHLAIYEKVGLTIRSMCVWPMALTNCYTTFFGRRQTDHEAIVMLLNIEAKYSNLVICRHKNPLWACSIPIGAQQLNDEKVVTRLAFELAACRNQLISMHPGAVIERLIFLTGLTMDASIYSTIAKQMEIQAQMGDCLAAVETKNPFNAGVDRREPCVNWATAFGLSLS